MARPGFDPITLVGAAYDVELDDGAWINSLVGAAQPGLEHGYGMSGSLWERPVLTGRWGRRTRRARLPK